MTFYITRNDYHQSTATQYSVGLVHADWRLMADSAEELDCDADLVDLVYMYLSTKSYPKVCSENKKRIIRKKCACFRVDKGGELQYKEISKAGGRKVQTS